MNEEAQTSGQVITFYSYKGGTGRSMALANVACLLAQRQAGNVLMVDWDLEAPGLHRYFRDRFKVELGSVDTDRALDERPGLIDLFLELDRATRGTQAEGQPQSEESARELADGLDLQRFILRTDIPSLHLLKAGRFSEEYAARVNSFDWVGLFQRSPWLIHALAERLTGEYRYVLIDSRTGLTDISGICTMLMPERLVVVFTPNRQSLTGVLDLIRRATKYRRQSDNLRPLIAFPLPSRIDDARPILRDSWRFGDRERGITGFEALFEEAFKEVYDLTACDLRRYFDEVQVYHVPDYAYGEEIAVLVERGSDRRSLSRSFESFAHTLVDRAGPWEDQELEETQHVADEQSRAAEAAFARLTPEEQEVARRVFTNLVVLARPGEGGEDTRRRARMSELGPGAPEVVKALAAARLVTVSQGKEKEEETVELANEALVRNWLRLRQWLDEDREFLLWRQQLRGAATDWENNPSDPDLFFRRSRLKETELRLAKRQPSLSITERRFLQASASRLQRLRFQWALGVVVVGMIFALVALFSFRQSEQKSRIALASKLAARALNVLDNQRDLALLLSLESLRLNDTAEARSSLLKGLQQAEPRIRASLGAERAVGGVAFSPNGTLLAASTEAGNILVWDAVSGNLRCKIAGRSQGIASIAFSPNGRTLVSGNQDGIVLWEGRSCKKLLASSYLDRQGVRSVAFSPDGKIVASGSSDPAPVLWDAATARPLRMGKSHPDNSRNSRVNTVAFSPDGNILATGNLGGVTFWDPRTRSERDRLYGPGSSFDIVAFSPNGKLLATTNDNNSLVLWDVAARREITARRGFGRLRGVDVAGIGCIAFSPNGAILAVGLQDGTIRLLDATTLVLQRPPLTGHQGPVRGLAFSPDGKTLATSGDDKSVRLWDVPIALPLGRALPLPASLDVAFRRDGKLLAVGGTQGVFVRDLSTGRTVPFSSLPVHSVTFSPDGRLLAAGGDSTALVIDVASGRSAEPLSGFPGPVRSVVFSPDGQLLAASSGNQISLRDKASRWLLDRPLTSHRAVVYGLAFSPDGKLLASASADLRLWDVASRQGAGTLERRAREVLSVAFSPDGKTLASGDVGGAIDFWDVVSRQRLFQLGGGGHQSGIAGLSFSPNGEILASSDLDGGIALRATKSAQRLCELQTTGDGKEGGLAFSPDGKTLATAGAQVILWDVDLNSWKSRACSLAARNLTLDEWKDELGKLAYHKTCPTLPGPSDEKGAN